MVELMEKVRVRGLQVSPTHATCCVIYDGSMIDYPVYYADKGCTRWTCVGEDFFPAEVKQRVVQYLKSNFEHSM